MPDTQEHRRERQALVDRLALEYAGAVPPGQVLAAVVRADRLLRASAGGRLDSDLGHCEAIARRALAERAAWRPRWVSAVAQPA